MWSCRFCKNHSNSWDLLENTLTKTIVKNAKSVKYYQNRSNCFDYNMIKLFMISHCPNHRITTAHPSGLSTHFDYNISKTTLHNSTYSLTKQAKSSTFFRKHQILFFKLRRTADTKMRFVHFFQAFGPPFPFNIQI